MKPSHLWPSFVPLQSHADDAVNLTAAKGHRLTFADGRELLCATSGLWNVNYGYGNEAIADAIASAARDASYLSVFRYENTYAHDAADRLVEATDRRYDRVVFSTSGGAANDVATKLVRQSQALRGQPRDLIVALTGSYHGLTFGAFALTGEDLAQRLYGVDTRRVRHVPVNDIEALSELLATEGHRVAAVIVEPILGSGAVVLDERYIEELLHQRSRHGYLLIADEVASGYWRTGPFLASNFWPQSPDIVIVSKGLTNGTQPAAAILVAPHVTADFFTNEAVLVHGETQAGTATTAAAIIATLDESVRLNVTARAADIATMLDRKLAALDTAWVGDTRGVGAFRALDILGSDGNPIQAGEVAKVVASIRETGAVVHPGVAGIQLIPSLLYSEAEVDELFSCVVAGVEAASSTFAR